MPLDIQKPTEDIRPAVRVMQIILLATSMGVVMFGGFVVSQRGIDLNDWSIPGAFAWIALGMGAFGLLLSRVLPGLLPIEKGLAAAIDPATGTIADRKRLIGGVQTRMIVSAAICEGFAFVNIAAHMLEGSTPNIAMALVLFIAMFTLFPTLDSVAAAVDAMERAAREKAQWK